MNISRQELALGGSIHHKRGPNGKVRDVTCLTREGHVLTDCTLVLFQRFLKRRLVRSRNGSPYRVLPLRIKFVRARLNQR
ncbi:MAG: hypothetical protein GDA49_10765 [Rhodospirillales bacterium]|nr:hypothetical protein [Rhodospirillales bacterium]